MNSPRPRKEQPQTQGHPVGEILIVDDEVFIQNAFRLYFETIGYSVWVADDGVSAFKAFNNPDAQIDVVLLDLVMPGVNGLDLLRAFKSQRPDVEVIIATGCGSISSAIEAMRNGAFDYITKPIINFERDLLKVVEDALLHRRKRHHVPENLRTGDAGEADPSQTLALFDHLVSLANLGALWKLPAEDEANPGESEKTLEEVEELLKDKLGISSGLLFTRRGSGEFLPLYSWGDADRVEFSPQWFSNRQLFDAASDGKFMVFSIEDLNLESLGFPPTRTNLYPVALHLPILLEGVHRGALFLFFPRDLISSEAPCVLYNGQSYLLLAPLLGSLFFGLMKGTVEHEEEVRSAQEQEEEEEVRGAECGMPSAL